MFSDMLMYARVMKLKKTKETKYIVFEVRLASLYDRTPSVGYKIYGLNTLPELSRFKDSRRVSWIASNADIASLCFFLTLMCAVCRLRIEHCFVLRRSPSCNSALQS